MNALICDVCKCNCPTDQAMGWKHVTNISATPNHPYALPDDRDVCGMCWEVMIDYRVQSLAVSATAAPASDPMTTSSDPLAP